VNGKYSGRLAHRSIVKRINVLCKADSFSVLSRRAVRTINTVTRLAPPTRAAFVSAERLNGWEWPLGLPEYQQDWWAAGTGLLVEQVGKGMPGSEVTCQQDTKPVRKVHNTTVRTNPTPLR